MVYEVVPCGKLHGHQHAVVIQTILPMLTDFLQMALQKKHEGKIKLCFVCAWGKTLFEAKSPLFQCYTTSQCQETATTHWPSVVLSLVMDAPSTKLGLNRWHHGCWSDDQYFYTFTCIGNQRGLECVDIKTDNTTVFAYFCQSVLRIGRQWRLCWPIECGRVKAEKARLDLRVESEVISLTAQPDINPV